MCTRRLIRELERAQQWYDKCDETSSLHAFSPRSFLHSRPPRLVRRHVPVPSYMASRGQTCTDDESCLGSHTFCYQNGCDCNRKSALEGDDCDQPSAASAWSLAVRTIVLLGYLVVFTKCCWVIQQHRRQWGPLCSWRAKRATVFFLLVASVVMCISPLVGIANTLGWHIRKNVFMDLTTYADAFGASVGLVAYLIVAFNWLDIISSTQSLRSMKTGGLLRRSKVWRICRLAFYCLDSCV